MDFHIFKCQTWHLGDVASFIYSLDFCIFVLMQYALMWMCVNLIFERENIWGTCSGTRGILRPAKMTKAHKVNQTMNRSQVVVITSMVLTSHKSQEQLQIPTQKMRNRMRNQSDKLSGRTTVYSSLCGKKREVHDYTSPTHSEHYFILGLLNMSLHCSLESYRTDFATLLLFKEISSQYPFR